MAATLGKAIIYPLGFALMYVSVTIGTYIPLFGSPSLSLWHVSEPTVRMTAETADISNGEVRIPEAEKACDHVPFLQHAIAAPPKSVRVVVSLGGVDKGEMRVDCDTGNLIADSIKTY